MYNTDNLILIGMPGCGKSSVGRSMHTLYGMPLLDSDREIERREGMRLSKVIERCGDEGFRRIENEVNASLDVHGTIIAPGGSVVYGAEAMAHLKAIGTVIYLQLPYAEVARRLGDLHARGITFRPGQTLLDLFEERRVLYERYADLTVPCLGLMPYQVTRKVQAMLGPDFHPPLAPREV